MVLINKVNILRKVFNGQLSLNKGYHLLYKEKQLKKARFVKLSIKTNESRGVDTLLKTLFIVPVPISLLKLFLKNKKELINENIPFTIYEIITLFAYKGFSVDIVSSDGVKVIIKTI